MEHYERLTTAQENGDSDMVEAAMKLWNAIEALRKRHLREVYQSAKDDRFCAVILRVKVFSEAIRRVAWSKTFSAIAVSRS